MESRDSAVPEYFVWKSQDRTAEMQIGLALIERMRRIAEESAAGRSEAGGVLLGHIGQVTNGVCRVFVERFEPFPSRHGYGLPFRLNSEDQRQFETFFHGLRRTALSPVGIFRVHLRKGLYLEQPDATLLENHFDSPCSPFLLIRPRKADVPVAGLVLRGEGAVEARTPEGVFPMSAEALRAGKYTISTGEEAALAIGVVTASASHANIAEPLPAAPLVQPLPPRAALAPRWPPPVSAAPRSKPAASTRPLWLSSRMTYAGIGFALIAAAAAIWLAQRSGGPDPAEAGHVALSLNAQQRGKSMVLHWNPAAVAARNANRGVLWITDGGRRVRADLNAAELKEGTFRYTPQSTDVDFRLEAFKASDELSESVRVIPERFQTTATSAAPPGSTVQTAGGAQSGEAARTATGTDSAPPRRREHAPVRPEREFVPDAPALPAPAPPVTTAAAPPPKVPELHTGQAVHPAHVAIGPPPPAVLISTAAVPPGRLHRIFGHVPGLRRLRHMHDRTDDGFSPAKPVREVKPRIPPDLVTNLPPNNVVTIKVGIDAAGRITKTELVSAEPDHRLAFLTSDAIGKWSFEPARLNDRPVASELLVTLRVKTPARSGS